MERTQWWTCVRWLVYALHLPVMRKWPWRPALCKLEQSAFYNCCESVEVMSISGCAREHTHTYTHIHKLYSGKSWKTKNHGKCHKQSALYFTAVVFNQGCFRPLQNTGKAWKILLVVESRDRWGLLLVWRRAEAGEAAQQATVTSRTGPTTKNYLPQMSSGGPFEKPCSMADDYVNILA